MIRNVGEVATNTDCKMTFTIKNPPEGDVALKITVEFYGSIGVAATKLWGCVECAEIAIPVPVGINPL